MSYYRRLSFNDDVLHRTKDLSGTTTRETATLVRRLLPLAGQAGSIVDVAQGLGKLPLRAAPERSVAAALPSLHEQASALVPGAAAILDEEMARGVLGARDVAPALRSHESIRARPSGREADLVGDLHAFIDRLSSILPAGGAATPGQAACSLPVLRAKSVVVPGRQVALSMQLHNFEADSVCLKPSVTDLLGSNGGSIEARCVAFSAAELVLARGQRQTLTLSVVVPYDCRVGVYCGLLVMTGVADLRALVLIDVGSH